MENLDPQLLAQILALRQNGYGARGGSGMGTQASLSGAEGTPLNDWNLIDYGFGKQYGTGDGSSYEYDPSQDATFIAGKTDGGSWGNQRTPIYDTKGQFLGFNSGDGDNLAALKFIAASVGGYYGAGALNGMGAAGAAGATGGADAATSAAWANGAGLGGDTLSAMGLGADSAAAAGTAGVSGLGQAGSAASTATQAANQANNAATNASTAKTVAGLLGAAAGAASSGDQQKTSSVEPWAPAQPMLKGLIDQLPALQQQYAQQPFNDAQKAGYNNMAGLLDLVNKNAGGLLSGFQANASGANQFQRGRPGLLQGSTFNPSPQEWSPQSYGRFGG